MFVNTVTSTCPVVLSNLRADWYADRHSKPHYYFSNTKLEAFSTYTKYLNVYLLYISLHDIRCLPKLYDVNINFT